MDETEHKRKGREIMKQVFEYIRTNPKWKFIPSISQVRNLRRKGNIFLMEMTVNQIHRSEKRGILQSI